MTAVVVGKVYDPRAIGATAAAAYISYWFVNSDVSNVYYFGKYYYRQIGPGRFDSNGNFIGDYEIKQVMRTTKNKKNSGGQVNTKIVKSTVPYPTF